MNSSNLDVSGQYQNSTQNYFELRTASVERTKKRLDKYRKKSENKEIIFDQSATAKLALDMADTEKYLQKVTEQKQRKKTGRDKKDEKTGIGGRVRKNESFSEIFKKKTFSRFSEICRF